MGMGNSSRRRARKERAKNKKKETNKRRNEHKRLKEQRRYRNEHWDELTPVERMCTTKRRYATMDEATATIIRRSAHGGGALRAYKCPNCGGYHISSTPLGELPADGKEHSSEQF